MIKYILIIFGVISIVIIAKIIINKINNKEEEKEIEFNEFDDLEKIKQKKKDKEQIENELKALEKIRQEKEYSEFIKKDKEWEQKYLKNGKKLEYKKDIQQIILDSVDSIKKKIKNKEKRKKTEILENFNPEKENKIYEGSEINEINENYNNFNLDLFKKWSEGIFLCIEIGEKKELELIKKCILPEMYNRLIKNANELNKDGLKLQREEIFIEEIKLIDYGKNIRKEEKNFF